MTVVVLGDRYDRQTRIRWWDQDRLRAARVAVIGAGALGNELVKNLVLLGVGSILVVDFDHVELSNLARCIFFRPDDDGASKAETLATRASEVNDDVEIVGLHRDVRSLGTGLFRRADVVVGALDNREARLYLNRLAWRTDRPWVDGAIEALSGVARVFRPPTSCYECTLGEDDFAALAHRQSCRLLGREDMLGGKVPTTATMASIVAGLQVQEVVKLLHDGREGINVLDGGYVLDGANNDAYVVRYPFVEECTAHHVFGDPVVIPPDATPRQAADAVGFDEAIIELADDMVTSWRCPTCDAESTEGRPACLLSIAEATCPMCDEVRQPIAITSVVVPGPQQGVPLARLGVRADELLAIRRGVDHRYVWLRAADDLPESWR